MHTTLGTRWEGIPTPMDKMFFPSIDLAPRGSQGQTSLLVCGTPSFVLSFHLVEAICGYDETVYWFFAEEVIRPQHILNRISESRLLKQVRELRDEPCFTHFLVCGGDMCWEIVAFDNFELQEYAPEEAAYAAFEAERSQRIRLFGPGR